MGQELLDRVGFIRHKRKYYVATNSKGHKVVRGTSEKIYTHATIAGGLSKWGNCYATFTTRLDLAQRYSRSWEGSEVVEVKEITSKEARSIKKEIEQIRENYLEQQAKATATIYDIDRELVNGN